MRIIGLDIQRAFPEAVAWDDGERKRLGVSTCAAIFLGVFARGCCRYRGARVASTRTRTGCGLLMW